MSPICLYFLHYLVSNLLLKALH
ncbi:hypothetical protein V12B01_12750 [Vibrio splendidus 12B01]|nr:hypothetical protein V12B01_12750 [Vibrio splendidus 12B01]